jgi:hypothetical protein
MASSTEQSGIEPRTQRTERSWCEWQRTRMTAPQRAAHLWLAVVVAIW